MGICRRQTNLSLFDLQRKYKNRSHLKPQWQRGDVWSKKKREDFERTVMDKAKNGTDILTGCVILYCTEADKENFYISDGLQRTLNSGRIYEKLVKDVGETSAENILSKVSVPVLEMEYRDEKEAKDEFRRINQGTPLTPNEEAKTILTDLANYEDWEGRVLEPIHNSVINALHQFNVKVKNSRSRKHNDERDDYALFLRYLTQEQKLLRYNLNVSNIENESKRQAVLEQKLVNELNKIGIDAAEKKVAAFRGFLQDQVVYLKEMWQSVPKESWESRVQTLTSGCLRLLLHLSIFRKNRSIPVDRFSSFLKKFFNASKGTSNVIFSDGSYRVIGRGDIGGFAAVQQKLGCVFDPDLDRSLARKHSNTAQLKHGMHNAHLDAYSKTNGGEQVTVPMSAVKNLSMGTSSFT